MESGVDEWDDWKAWNLISFSGLTHLLASTAMVIGGVVPYIPQYIEIKRSKNSSGFSTFVCLALIAANSLRIIFWFGKKFETPLLIQSVVMIIAMFIMMEICLRMRQVSVTPAPSTRKKAFHRKERTDEQLSTDAEDDVKEDDCCINGGDVPVSLPSSPPTVVLNRRFNKKTFTDLNPRDFWQWTDLVSYIECTSTFMIVVGLLMYLFMETTWFVESIGYASLLTEACLAVPQLYRNLRSHSTTGMSASMVLLWAGGDLFKTGYFVIKQVPMQFIICGIIQVTVDLMILAQVALYSNSSSSKSEKKIKKKKDSVTSTITGPKEMRM